MALWDNLHLHEPKHRLRPHLSSCRNEALATLATSYNQTSLCLYSVEFFTRHLFWRAIPKTWRFSPKMFYYGYSGAFDFSFATAFLIIYYLSIWLFTRWFTKPLWISKAKYRVINIDINVFKSQSRLAFVGSFHWTQATRRLYLSMWLEAYFQCTFVR